MTDQQTEIALQGVIITTSGDTVAAPSIDLTEFGVLYVDMDGVTSLMPWHRVARIAFFDGEPVPVETSTQTVPKADA